MASPQLVVWRRTRAGAPCRIIVAASHVAAPYLCPCAKRSLPPGILRPLLRQFDQLRGDAPYDQRPPPPPPNHGRSSSWKQQWYAAQLPTSPVQNHTIVSAPSTAPIRVMHPSKYQSAGLAWKAKHLPAVELGAAMRTSATMPATSCGQSTSKRPSVATTTISPRWTCASISVGPSTWPPQQSPQCVDECVQSVQCRPCPQCSAWECGVAAAGPRTPSPKHPVAEAQ